jgi:hypothetical protein
MFCCLLLGAAIVSFIIGCKNEGFYECSASAIRSLVENLTVQLFRARNHGFPKADRKYLL